MDIKIDQAYLILEIPKEYRNNLKYIRTQYYRLSLIHHPDKNSSPEATKKFQEISEAYHCIESINKNQNYSNNNTYNNILESFVSNFLTTNMYKIVLAIVNHDNIYSTLFSNISKENSSEIYQFMCKNQEVFNISTEKMDIIKTIIQDKFKNDDIITVTPTIDDMYNNKIYKMVINDKTYAVPLWHSELYFDKDDGHNIIVFCSPLLSDNVRIDEHNNVYVKYSIPFSMDYLLPDSSINVQVGLQYNIDIPCNTIMLQRQQIILLKHKGISKVVEKDIYSTDPRGNMYIELIFT